MRSDEDVKNQIIDFAKSDDRVRAVLLNGSRANPFVKKDNLRDFDIVYLVTEVESFINDHKWVDYFGSRLIWQMPGGMHFISGHPEVERKDQFTYLILFEDHYRIDLTLKQIPGNTEQENWDSLTKVWLDKDGIAKNIPQSTDIDYHVKMPSQKIFTDTCNEFWWVVTYVIKGLLRGEVIYSKDMLDRVVRPRFMDVIAWKIGTEHDFSVSVGKSGRFLDQYLPKLEYRRIMQTYSGNQLKENWDALLMMTEIFATYAQEVAQKLHLAYNLEEGNNIREYLRDNFRNWHKNSS